MPKRTRTISSDDDFIIPKPSTKRQKIIKSKKTKTTTTSSVANSSFSSPAAPSDLPSKAVAFLNYLKNDVAEAFSLDVIKEHNPSKLINPKNLVDCTVDQLLELKGLDGRGGKFFYDWMRCLIKSDHINNPPHKAPNVYVTLNGRYLSVYDAAREFNNDKKIFGFNIYSHHIVLRAKEQKALHSMSSNPSSYSGSHLCDSEGCLRAKHLELELYDFNASRKCCPGVVLWVINNCITDVNSCRHGFTHPKFEEGGDDLKFACRKLRVVKISM